jgi:hypothetical protein
MTAIQVAEASHTFKIWFVDEFKRASPAFFEHYGRACQEQFSSAGKRTISCDRKPLRPFILIHGIGVPELDLQPKVTDDSGTRVAEEGNTRLVDRVIC